MERLINGRYRTLARLGSGRLGIVYEALDEQGSIPGSERRVAIQLLEGNLITGRRFTGEFELGVRSLQALSHPNIVGLVDSGRDDGHYFLVTELQDSASLRFVLDEAGKLPFAEAAAVVRAVGDALQYLHVKSIVHGNLKPENVLVTFDYEVKLLDVVPPEWPAAMRGDPDTRDDVHGLACLAYEMLSGRHPFNANTAEEAYHAGLKPTPVAALSVRQWRALSAALELQREHRTPTVAQFLEEFGVTGDETLRATVANDSDSHAETAPAPEPAAATAPHIAPAPAPAAAPAPVQAPAPTPAAAAATAQAYAAAPERSWSNADVVLPERVVAYEPRRSGVAGKLLVLFVLMGLGALAYTFQDLLRDETATLIAAIDARIPDAAPPVSEPPVEQAPPQAAPAPKDVPVETPPASAGVAEAPAITAVPDGAPDDVPVPAITVEDAPVAEAVPAAPEAPGPTRFGFAQSQVTVRESDVAARIVIRRSGDTTQRATVAWWTDEGSALAGQDFADLGRRVERFEPGEMQRTIFVPLTNDPDAEPAKSFNVFLGSGSRGRSVSEPLSGMRVDIVDDD